MAPLFAKRLNCFYCGRRSPRPDRDPLRKWRCQHCEAVNHLDEKGDITDPPTTETNPDLYGPDASDPPFESADLTGSGLFCAQCVRHQHLFTSALAAYFPSPEDPNYAAYEREYPKFRKNLEERYPQVCARCEPLVKERIRQTGYEAKSDHLRRMMDRSKAGRAARQARKWNWRSLLVFAGAMGYWVSIAGQLSWNLWSALAVDDPLRDPDESFRSPSILSCIQHTVQARQVPGDCSTDLAPYAGLALVAGILALWYNPKLRLKVEGRGGRFVGLGEYYKVQLIVMVARCAFWAVLRDPSSSGLDPSLPPALHVFMIFFSLLSVAISRRIVQYDTRPLVTWTDNNPAATPQRKAGVSPLPNLSSSKQSSMTPNGTVQQQAIRRFPLEKLATPQSTPSRELAIPTPPPEGQDDMDWTPSVQYEIRPMVSVRPRDSSSVLDGPLPFYGSLPAAPQPPSWNLRNQPAQRQKPIEHVVERNPFHRAPAQSLDSWQRNTGSSDPVFAPPKFFPTSDHAASTGLENLFDRTFTIKSHEDDEGENSWKPQPGTADQRPQRSTDLQSYFIFQYLRLGLLLASLTAWLLSQYSYGAVPGNYIEVVSLGIVSLLAGFALLEVLKQPIVHWNGMEILVYIAELAAAVYLGGNLPRASFERHYFDRYGKLLLVFMAVQEALGLLSLYQFSVSRSPLSDTPAQPEPQQLDRIETSRGDLSSVSPQGENDHHSGFQSFASQSSVPPLSFSSTLPGSSFITQPIEVQQRSPFSTYQGGFNKVHSFSLNSLKENESDASDPLDRDSDAETTATATTTATSNTNRNIRYGGSSNNDPVFSPRRSDIGPGIGGLSLDDRPHRRMTRSQTQRIHGSGSAGVRRTPADNFGRY